MAADWRIQPHGGGIGYVLVDEHGYPQAQGSMRTLRLNPQFRHTDPNRPFKAFEGIL